jgi:glycine/sarcosine/betaine reductase complex component A
MDAENQAQIKKIAEGLETAEASRDLIVVLGASDLDGALISAETVTDGDPSFSGPLAGVSLKLPVYHILEPEIRDATPEAIYEENVGIWALAMEPEKIAQIGSEFKSIRQKIAGQA